MMLQIGGHHWGRAPAWQTSAPLICGAGATSFTPQPATWCAAGLDASGAAHAWHPPAPTNRGDMSAFAGQVFQSAAQVVVGPDMANNLWSSEQVFPTAEHFADITDNSWYPVQPLEHAETVATPTKEPSSIPLGESSPPKRNKHRRGRGRGDRSGFRPLLPSNSTFSSDEKSPTKSSIRATPCSADKENEDAYSELSSKPDDGTQLEKAQIGLQGSVVRLAFGAQGCRVVQDALKDLPEKEADALAAELQGHIQSAIESPHANYVVQKIVEVLRPAKSRFVVEELQGIACKVARHKYGCRVIQRLLEHHAKTDDAMAALIANILLDVKDLSRSAYGHHVVVALIEHGTDEQTKTVAHALCEHIDALMHSRHARHVLIGAMRTCSAEDQQHVVAALFSSSERVSTMAASKNSKHLIEAALEVRVCPEWAQRMRSMLSNVAAHSSRWAALTQ